MYYAEVGERFNPVGSRPIVSLAHAGSKQNPFQKRSLYFLELKFQNLEQGFKTPKLANLQFAKNLLGKKKFLPSAPK